MAARDIRAPVPGWQPPALLTLPQVEGAHGFVRPLDSDNDGSALWQSIGQVDHIWEFIGVGPFATRADFDGFLEWAEDSRDPLFCVIGRRGEAAGGIASYLRITPGAGTAELGFIVLGPALQRTPVSTEAFSALIGHAFDSGYRRFEWKCDAANLPSRRAAIRLGYSFEGVFRKAMVVKGLNRDTAWFSILDEDWPAIRQAHKTWLGPDNFDAVGAQRQSLGPLTAPFVETVDPVLASGPEAP